MQITCLGHAGFLVETEHAMIVMDPWVSAFGAFDASWFQYPRNHHMAPLIQEKFKATQKQKYIYISHDHKDHFDLPFLESLEDRDFTLVLAAFENPVVFDTLQRREYACKEIICLKDGEPLAFDGGSIVLFILDIEPDCDSAILVQTPDCNFLNINDASIQERLADITARYGQINVYAGQFSGAIWHPTCYEMPQEVYEIISRNKILKKFDAIANAISLLQPSVYLPSAGPPCFLDPMLYSINLQKVNIYPRAPALIAFLDEKFKDVEIQTRWPEIMPGDVLDTASYEFVTLADERLEESGFEAYLREYAREYEGFFAERAREHAKIDAARVFEALKPVLEYKLEKLGAAHKNIPLTLYWMLDELPDRMYRIHFADKSISVTSRVMEVNYFLRFSTPAWEMNKVLTGELSWPDFALTFRMRLLRKPDIYNTLVHGFLTINPGRIADFCKHFYAITAREERMEVEVNGKIYSVLRYCPHQGGDLSCGWVEDCFLVCPRHHWKFDVENDGKCRYNDAGIKAIFLRNK